MQPVSLRKALNLIDMKSAVRVYFEMEFKKCTVFCRVVDIDLHTENIDLEKLDSNQSITIIYRHFLTNELGEVEQSITTQFYTKYGEG